MVDVPADVLDELELNLALEANQYEALLMEALEERGLAEFAQKRHPAGSSKGDQFAPKDVIAGEDTLRTGGKGGEVGTFIKDDPRKNLAVGKRIERSQKSPTDVELDAMDEYAVDGDVRINNKLRRGGDLSKKDKATAQTMDAAINKRSLSQDVVSYRGVDSSAVKKAFGDELRVGDVLSDKAFTSTSYDRDMSADYIGNRGIMAVIRIPKGTKALALGSAGGQSELLLKRGSKFKVLGARKGEIHLEVVK